MKSEGSSGVRKPSRVPRRTQALRTSFFTFEDYRLETVAQELLAEGKTITPDQDKVAEIERLFVEDKAKLAEYNLNDAILVTNIFKNAGLIELSIRRSQLSGLLMDELGMMTAAFDHFFLPKLHRAGMFRQMSKISILQNMPLVVMLWIQYPEFTMI